MESPGLAARNAGFFSVYLRFRRTYQARRDIKFNLNLNDGKQSLDSRKKGTTDRVDMYPYAYRMSMIKLDLRTATLIPQDVLVVIISPPRGSPRRAIRRRYRHFLGVLNYKVKSEQFGLCKRSALS
jgi:hypothetical protein